MRFRRIEANPRADRSGLRIGARLGAYLTLLLIAGCQTKPVPPASWHQETGYRWRDLTVPKNDRVGFTILPAKTTGVVFSNEISDSLARYNRILAHGAGVALGDVDGDGRVDIYLTRVDGANALFRNMGGWRFEEIAESSGARGPRRGSTAPTFADADGDGDLDLFLSVLGGPNELFINDGKGRFVADTGYAGRSSKYGSVTSALADVDGDGDLDLFVTTHKAHVASDRFSPVEKSFELVTRRVGPNRYEIHERWRHEFRLVSTEQGLQLQERGEPDLLYLNDGKGRFDLMPTGKSPRFLDENGNQFAEDIDHFGLAARFYDVNGDRAPELFIANDYADPDQFWINDGRGNFSLADRLAIRSSAHSAMAFDFADVNRDGLVDFFEADMRAREARMRRRQQPAQMLRTHVPGVLGTRPQYARNFLFVNRGDNSFAQVAEFAGIDASGWTWSTMFLDVDLDGYEDLLVTTGNLWNEVDPDVFEFFRETPEKYQMQEAGFGLLELPNYAFRNRGDLTFEEVGNRWGFNAGPDISHGFAAGDLDGDGDLDIVVNRLNKPTLVFRNDATAPRIAVRLAGKAPNTYGVGAKIRVLGGPVAVQEREVTAGGLYLSHSDYQLTFATGSSDSVTIEVIWRDGSRSSIRAAANREYQIDQANAVPGAPDTSRAPDPLFSELSGQLAHTHVEPAFRHDDARQVLRLSTMSELGPGVTIYDVDNDGDEDVIVGTGTTGTLTWHRNDRGRFTAFSTGIVAKGDLTTLLPVPATGGLKLLVGQSSYESLDDALQMTPVIAAFPFGPRRTSAASEVDPSSTAVGPMSLADIDGDHDLDLFVGGRVVPGEYPRNPRNRIYSNRGDGSFALDTVNSAALDSSGMVSAALFSDVDRDHDVDLLLATDWGPVRLYLNQAGVFRPAPTSWGLSTPTSRWIGLATGDFDRDGRPDLVTTSLGKNLRDAPDSAKPVILYFGNFDQDHVLDLLVAQYDSSLQAEAPLTSYDRARAGMPELGRRFNTYAAYADATIQTILGPSASRAARLTSSSTAHYLWLNRGDHFERHLLPLEAQLAPAFAPVVADFDGDGNDDLFLAQNLTPVEFEQLPLDAGRGLLLLGDGRGGFRAASGQESGIVVYGDQRGAATGDLDGDGRSDLIVTQNGSATKYFRNKSGIPGVRVTLIGPPSNPTAVGASLRIECQGVAGPLREIQEGSGYWSVTGMHPVLGRSKPGACQVKVEWPDGSSTSTDAPPDVLQLRISWQPRK